jgi:hypothetical protein
MGLGTTSCPFTRIMLINEIAHVHKEIRGNAILLKQYDIIELWDVEFCNMFR